MEKPIVACVQHRLIIPETVGDYDAHLNRFMRIAKAKGAALALFPELSGLATAIPTFSGWRNALLKTAGKAQQQKTGLWQRTKSKLAGSAANVVGADLNQSLLQALAEMPESLHDAYISGFSNLARQYEMTIVAGSLYELNPVTNELQNVSLVFGPEGELLGRQAKVMLGQRDKPVAQPSDGWGVIPTPAGRVGILLGNDVLYPEPARILAYQGADMLLAMGAVSKPATYHKIRQATLARCQENQLYGMVSFLVGPNPFADPEAPPFVGKSAIFAPLEFTPGFSGVMVQIGSPLAEGVITAEWDYPALEALWQDDEAPLRREMPLRQAGPILASVYSRAVTLAEVEKMMLEGPPPDAEVPEAEEEAIPGDEDLSDDSEEDIDFDPDEVPPVAPFWPDVSMATVMDEIDEEERAQHARMDEIDATAVEVAATIPETDEETDATPDPNYDEAQPGSTLDQTQSDDVVPESPATEQPPVEEIVPESDESPTSAPDEPSSGMDHDAFWEEDTAQIDTSAEARENADIAQAGSADAGEDTPNDSDAGPEQIADPEEEEASWRRQIHWPWKE